MPGKLAGKGLAKDESQWLGAFASLAEDPHSIPSTHVVTQQPFITLVPGGLMPSADVRETKAMLGTQIL